MSAESLRTLIRTFKFEEADRPSVALSDSTKIYLDSLSGLAGAIRLRPDSSTGYYSTDGGLFVVAPVARPAAARQLLGFQAFIDHQKVDGVQVTTEGFRLFDGASHFFWNGSAWAAVAPSSSSWNTEDEVAAHISGFPVLPTMAFSVVVNLGTTNRKYTPVLKRLKVAYAARIWSTLEDILYRSLARAIGAGVRPFSDVVLSMPATAALVDVGALLADVEIPFNLAGVEAVFNRTDDPNLLVDLLSSYDATAKIATLTAAVTAGKVLHVVITHAPEVAVDETHPDYREVSKNPSFVIDQVEEVSSALTSHTDGVVNKATGTAIIVQPPYMGSLRFRVTATGPTSLDAKRMIEALKDWAIQRQVIQSTAMDEGLRLMLREDYRGSSTPSATGSGSASCVLEILNVPFFSRPSLDGYAIRQVVLNTTPQ